MKSGKGKGFAQDKVEGEDSMLLYSVAREQSGTGERARGERARKRKTVKVKGRRSCQSFARGSLDTETIVDSSPSSS